MCDSVTVESEKVSAVHVIVLRSSVCESISAVVQESVSVVHVRGALE